jgi:hypothetical protein
MARIKKHKNRNHSFTGKSFAAINYKFLLLLLLLKFIKFELCLQNACVAPMDEKTYRKEAA